MVRRLFLLLVGVLAAASFRPANAQQSLNTRVVPRDDYFLARRGYYGGDYATALRAFRSVANGGISSTEGRWVDSICYHTMLGESYYHLGQSTLALEQYEAALKLAVAHGDWLLRVQFPDAIAPASLTNRNRITWGASARRSRTGAYPDTMTSFQGRLNNDNVIRNGGVVTPPNLFPLRVTEIVRCTGLSLYRRWELIGPAGAYTPLSSQIVETLSRRSAPANHWSQVWIEAQLGLAQAGAGKRAEAVAHLQRAIVAAGEYDHHLTPLVLLALGKLHLEDNRLEEAANYFLEASFSAAEFGQADVVSDALCLGLTTHLARGGQAGAYPPLVLALPWASREGYSATEANLAVRAAESYLAAGDPVRAVKMLDEARRGMARSEMRAADVGARYEYMSAQLAFNQGASSGAMKSLDNALRFQKKASPRLLQIALADQAFVSGAIAARVAKDLYELVLRDPTPADWATDPLDALAVMLTPLPGPMERWFGVAVERKELELALEISERIRRRPLLRRVAAGGRMLALRWIMEGPKESLSAAALLQRQDILAKFPRYAELQRQSDAQRAALAALPLSPDDAATLNQEKKLYDEWAKVARAQEAMLGDIALRRAPTELAFPQVRTMDKIKALTPQRQLVLSFFSTSRGMAVFLFTNEKFAAWVVEEPKKVADATADLLKQMGHFDGNHPLGREDLASEQWKTPATELLKLLMRNLRPDFWDDFDELVIVPDGLLWYVPFEALQVVDGGDSSPLIAKIRIRYAPMVNLAVPDGRGHKRRSNTMVVAGKLFPRDDDDITTEALDELRGRLPETFGLPATMPSSSSLQKSLWDRLIVLDDIDDRTTSPFGWSPVRVDRGKPGGSLADWLTLPFGAPDEVVLPAFHTPAESGVKRGATGDEIFLTLCGMMATGTRTVLLSRWRTGGQSSVDLTREFAQELPRTSAAKAWRRSVLLLRDTELDPHREPRIKPGAVEDSLKAQHPFFWSGYLLADTGSEPLVEDEPKRAPVVAPAKP